ncbi:trans-sialidase, partial [Trypanosoma cruzi]
LSSVPSVCVCAVLLSFFPLSTLSCCVPAWSGRMLTGHVDCECLLTASIHLSLSASLSFPVGCGVLHRVRAGPHAPTARRDARDDRCGVAVLAVSSLYLACFPFSLYLLNTHARKASKR